MESRHAREALVVLLLATAIGHELAEGGVGALSSSAPIASAPIASVLPIEAPTSIFKAKLGNGPDDDAELLVTGSWSATLLASLDLQAVQGGNLALASAQPLLFTQAPDLSLSFLLYKKIFVRTKTKFESADSFISRIFPRKRKRNISAKRR